MDAGEWQPEENYEHDGFPTKHFREEEDSPLYVLDLFLF
jgi:hypothetical protein